MQIKMFSLNLNKKVFSSVLVMFMGLLGVWSEFSPISKHFGHPLWAFAGYFDKSWWRQFWNSIDFWISIDKQYPEVLCTFRHAKALKWILSQQNPQGGLVYIPSTSLTSFLLKSFFPLWQGSSCSVMAAEPKVSTIWDAMYAFCWKCSLAIDCNWIRIW